jgi:hypothetical protein
MRAPITGIRYHNSGTVRRTSVRSWRATSFLYFQLLHLAELLSVLLSIVSILNFRGVAFDSFYRSEVVVVCENQEIRSVFFSRTQEESSRLFLFAFSHQKNLSAIQFWFTRSHCLECCYIFTHHHVVRNETACWQRCRSREFSSSESLPTVRQHLLRALNEHGRNCSTSVPFANPFSIDRFRP